MQPVLLEVGRLKIYSFGSFIALGAIVAGTVMYQLCRLNKITTKYLFDTVLYCLIASLIGARLGYYLTYRDQFQSFWQVFYFWQGGLLALTGLAVGFVTYLYFLRRHQLPLWSMLDIGALGLLSGWAVGKIGCHLSTCTVGRFTDSFFAVQASFPLDLFSVFWAALLFIVLLTIWRHRRLSDGVIFFLSLEGFFLGELLIKTLKADFGEGLVRTEAIIYLLLVVVIYLIFWRLHGPQFERRKVGQALKNLVFRRRR